MFYFLLKYYYQIKPIFLGKIVKIFFSRKNFIVGKNFQCYTFPKLLLDSNAKIEIGDNVILRRNVEIRAHKKSILKIKDNCRIDRGVRILSTNNAEIIIEKGVRIGLYSVFNGGDSIFVGTKTLISGFVYIQTSMHNFDKNDDIQNQGYIHHPITIGKDCWLGAHSVIFPNVVLEDKCIVGSNSVVNKSFKKKSIIAGVPVKLIKDR